MFNELVESFRKLFQPSIELPKFLIDLNAPIDIINMLYSVKGLDAKDDNDNSRYKKIEESDDFVLVLYKNLLDDKGVAVIDDIMLREGKPTLFIIMDYDIIMNSDSEIVIKAIFAATYSAVCFLKSKMNQFFYYKNGVMNILFKEAPIIIFIATVLSTFRRSEMLDGFMVQNIRNIEGREKFNEEELDKYIIVISKCGVEHILDNSIGAITNDNSKNDEVQ